MNRFLISLFFLLIFKQTYSQIDFKIAFGSCNKPEKENVFWDDILVLNPNVWIWGGDAIYADTENMNKMKRDYDLQMQQKGYKEIVAKIPVLGTWDDHDYGKNDAGSAYKMKKKVNNYF